MTVNTLSKPSINFDEVMQFMCSASTYELFRLKNYIANELESSVRIEHIKSKLRIGQVVEYFSTRSQKLQQGVVCKINIKYVVIELNNDGGRWNVPYCCLNIDSRPIENNKPTKLGTLTRNNISIGDIVGFTNNGIDIIGTVIKLNLKTASLRTKNNERWNVYYNHLFPIIDGESDASEPVTFIQG